MKTFRPFVSVLSVLFVLTLSAYPSKAQNIDASAANEDYSASAVYQQNETWNAIYTSKLKISGVGSTAGTTYGECHFNASGSFLCEEMDHGKSREYRGSYSINSSGTRFTSVRLNSKGILAMKRMLKDWVIDIAHDEGASIRSISLRFGKVSISKPTVDAVTGEPNNTLIKISGKVSAIVNGSRMTRGFSYRSTVSFF